MSGDLEDFLRRAAQRRQAKAVEQPKAEAPVKRAPQYSDSRSERIARVVDDAEEILTAEIVDDDGTSIAARMLRLEEAKRAAGHAEQAAAAKMRKVRGMLPRQQKTVKAITGNPVKDLIAAMQRPGGVQQAILLKEILDRPSHRW